MKRTGGLQILAGTIAATLLASAAHADDVVVQPSSGDGFVITDNTGTIERLRVDEATGNLSRGGTLFLHTPGTSNLFVGADAGAAITTGAGNAAFGPSATSNIWTGSFNAAFGVGALIGSASTGDGNSAFGYYALSGNQAAGNSAFGYEALMQNTTAGGNSAFGHEALKANKGMNNSAFGYGALTLNFTGEDNVAFGSEALGNSTVGHRNTAVGRRALVANGDSYGNTAIGFEALRTITNGSAQNSALGEYALRDLSLGFNNVALGRCAGCSLSSGNYNIYVGVGAGGPATETGSIRIGTGNNTQTFIEGIYGVTSPGGLAVFIDSNNQLGTSTSSIRFKREVRDMQSASGVLAKLRPVTFRYREEIAGGDDLLQYGLIAEEVAEVEPGLVAYDERGDPYSVRYQFLAPMLVNEYQRQQRTIDEQASRIRSQDAAIQRLTARLERLEAEVGTAVGTAR